MMIHMRKLKATVSAGHENPLRSHERTDRAEEQVYEREQDSYEPPRLDVLGRFEELTLGLAGSRADGGSGSFRPLV